MMQDPARALETQVREELNIHPAELAPLKDGLVTGTATAVGAFIPIAPFLVMSHGSAVWVVAGGQHGSRTSASARRAACSRAAGSGSAAATCSWSGSASLPWVT